MKPSRTCGSCTVCCTLQGVRDPEGQFDPKPPNVPCSKLCKTASGCAIYAHRPPECREFQCLWLQGAGEPEDRPDLLGVMFEVQDQVDPPYILARSLGRNRVGTRVRNLAREIQALTGLVVGVVHPDQTTTDWKQTADIEVISGPPVA